MQGSEKKSVVGGVGASGGIGEGPAGPRLEADPEIACDLVGLERGGETDRRHDRETGAGAAKKASPCVFGDGSALDEDREDGSAGSTDKQAQAGLEGEEVAGRALDATLGKDAEDAPGGDVPDGLAEAGRLGFAGAIDEDDAEPLPDGFEGLDAHVAGHDPSDLEGKGDLDEEGIDTCGVVRDNDEAFGTGCGDVLATMDTEAKDDPCVGPHGPPDEPCEGGGARAAQERAGGEAPEDPEAGSKDEPGRRRHAGRIVAEAGGAGR